jgi:hypothetical protein
MSAAERERRRAEWTRAVNAALAWARARAPGRRPADPAPPREAAG